MRALIFAAALAAAGPAIADSIARQGADWVRITARPCTNEAVLALLARADKDAHLDYRQASAEFNGVAYAPCWKPYGSGVHLQYEDGDEGLLLESELKPVPEA